MPGRTLYLTDDVLRGGVYAHIYAAYIFARQPEDKQNYAAENQLKRHC